jgi:hypothetical protein
MLLAESTRLLSLTFEFPYTCKLTRRITLTFTLQDVVNSRRVSPKHTEDFVQVVIVASI